MKNLDNMDCMRNLIYKILSDIFIWHSNLMQHSVISVYQKISDQNISTLNLTILPSYEQIYCKDK